MKTTLHSEHNESLFQGWIQNATHRAEWHGGNWRVYARDGMSFIYQGTVHASKNSALEDLVSMLASEAGSA